MSTKPIVARLPLVTLYVLCLLGVLLWALAVGASASPSASAPGYPRASLQAPQVAGVPLCGPTWSVITSPNMGTGNNILEGVAVVSSNDVWAVGNYNNGSMDQTLVEHWDGGVWSVVASSNVGSNANYLKGVAAVSSSDVWAVGYYVNGAYYETLVEHWNGSVWTALPSPSPGTNSDELYGVAAVSASDVWAVGYYVNGTVDQTLVEHWNGSSWSVATSPNPGANASRLYGVAAVSSSDVWAVGYYSNGSLSMTLVEHWNGSAWSTVTSPNVGTNNSYLNGVAVVSSSDVWAVGRYNNGTADQTLVEHWNGSAWSVVTSPNPGAINRLYGVAVVSSNDVWAVGDYNNGTAYRTLVESWDGSAWSLAASANVGANGNDLYGVAVVSAGDAWAVGNYANGTTGQTLVERYNPCPPTPTATPTACPVQFTDVPEGSTFYSYIRCLACRGIINGYPDNTFRPNAHATRGQLSKIISNAAGFSDPQTMQMFQDVQVGSTFQVYIGRLASRGYIGGYPCGGAGEPCVPPGNLPYFRPNNSSTRGQISKIDANAAGFSDIPTRQQFEDVAVGSTYYTYTYRLVGRSIMAGYPCGQAPAGPCVPPGNLPYFLPNNNATRGQTSKTVANTFYPDCQTPSRVKK